MTLRLRNTVRHWLNRFERARPEKLFADGACQPMLIGMLL
jgi:hypothetical protein